MLQIQLSGSRPGNRGGIRVLLPRGLATLESDRPIRTGLINDNNSGRPARVIVVVSPRLCFKPGTADAVGNLHRISQRLGADFLFVGLCRGPSPQSSVHGVPVALGRATTRSAAGAAKHRRNRAGHLQETAAIWLPLPPTPWQPSIRIGSRAR